MSGSNRHPLRGPPARRQPSAALPDLDQGAANMGLLPSRAGEEGGGGLGVIE